MELYPWTTAATFRIRTYTRRLDRLTARLRDSGRPLTQEDVDDIARVIMAYAGDSATPAMLEAYRTALHRCTRPGYPGPFRRVTLALSVDAHLHLTRVE